MDTFPSKSDEEIEVLIDKEEELEGEYHIHLQKNRGTRDNLFIGILVVLSIIDLTNNIVSFTWSTSEIIQRVIGLVLLSSLFWLTSCFYKYPFINKFFIAIFTYCLAV